MNDSRQALVALRKQDFHRRVVAAIVFAKIRLQNVDLALIVRIKLLLLLRLSLIIFDHVLVLLHHLFHR